MFSFKPRGAFNKMSKLSEEERARGVRQPLGRRQPCTGVAFSSQQTWPQSCYCDADYRTDLKVNTVRRLGGEAVPLWRPLIL